MQQQTIDKLAKHHPDCASVHLDIKQLIPENDAAELLKAGLTDCSYGNDECPSYYHPDKKDIEPVLMVVDDVDDDFNRISNKISYYITGEDFEYTNVIDAINAYNEL